MVSINKSLIDDIIKNWFPVIGILFIVAGMSYLFYEGVWQRLNEGGRLIFGFLTGAVMIAASYAIDRSAGTIADAVLGGGLLMLYLSLIFGSRFPAENIHALIPEAWALIIAMLFTLSVVFFSYTRRSQYILLVGILGGYLTPFFIGEVGGLKQFIADTGVFHYSLPLPALLIYFAAINVAILIVASRFFLRGIGVLNSLGLFIGTLLLFYFMGGKFPGNAANIAFFMICVVALHIGAMCINAKKFTKETDPYLLAGYLLPLVWFAASMNSFLENAIDNRILAVLLLGCAAIYFGGWHYLRKTFDHARHNALYIGGLVAIILAVTKLHSNLNHLDGPALALVSIIFGVLYCITPLPQREMSYFIFAVISFLVTLWHIDKLAMHDLGIFHGTTLVIIFSLLPFLLGSLFPDSDDEHQDMEAFRRFAYRCAGALILLLIFFDLSRKQDMPIAFLFFTLPAAFTCYLSYKKASVPFKLWEIKISLMLASAGFSTTFVTIIERFSAFPPTVGVLATTVSLVGLSTIVVMLLLYANFKNLLQADADALRQHFDAVWQFMLTFLLYLSIWSTLTHEIMALFNTVNIGGEGARNFATTVWWVCLSAYMIFIGIKNRSLVNQKNIGFGLLLLTILKILFGDLYDLNTNFKIFVFLLVGMLMLYISYMAHKKSGPDDALQ